MLHHLARSLLLGDSSLLALMKQVVMLGRPTMTSVMVIFKCQLGWTMVPRYLVKHYSGCFWCVCMKLRNAIFPAISVNKDVTVISDCSNHEWWAGMPKDTQEGKEYLPFSSHQTSHSPKHRILAPDRGLYQRNDFSEPRLFHLPIHRKVLNSLIWDIWFSFNSQ